LRPQGLGDALESDESSITVNNWDVVDVSINHKVDDGLRVFAGAHNQGRRVHHSVDRILQVQTVKQPPSDVSICCDALQDPVLIDDEGDL
jgi:hypothetical protein